jgi:hypothetical protein
MLFEIEAGYLQLLRVVHGDIKSWATAQGLVIERHLHQQRPAHPSEGVTRRLVKTNESHGVIQVAVTARTGARTPKTLVSLVDLVDACRGFEDFGDRSKEILLHFEGA